MYPKRQSYLVLGLSRSGRAATEYLLSRGAKVYIYDDVVSERVEQTAKALSQSGANVTSKEDLEKTCESCDVLVLSPGIPIDHPIAIAFKRSGKAVVGESELAARNMICPIIAVTGTNGKTTTVTMLTEILKKGGLDAKACGNIGAPMIEYVGMSQDEVAVTEISSFQLETLNSLRPHVAVVLNVTEDHLNRHYTMKNYAFLKAKLLKNLTEAEFAVLNYDDPITRGFSEKTRAKVLYFSVKERVRGAYFENGNLYFGKEKILSVDDLSVGGLHNVQNALASIAVAKIMGVSTEAIIAALSEFKGVNHRVQTILTADGVTYVNDSKGTNVDATLKAVAAMQEKTILLLGGKNKGYDYDVLFGSLSQSKIVHAILYGENRFALLKSARKAEFDEVTLCKRFELAVRVASMQAKRGQTVLLSPASASFDEFANYEERGDKFVEIVRSLTKEKEGTEESAVADGENRLDGGIVDVVADASKEE